MFISFTKKPVFVEKTTTVDGGGVGGENRRRIETACSTGVYVGIKRDMVKRGASHSRGLREEIKWRIKQPEETMGMNDCEHGAGWDPERCWCAIGEQQLRRSP